MFSNEKRSEIDSLVEEKELDIIGISESWAHEDISDSELSIKGFNMFRKDRNIANLKRGGGLVLFIKETIKAELVEDTISNQSESLWVKIVEDQSNMISVGLCYRRPSASIEETRDLCHQIKKHTLKSGLIMGEFNFGGIDWDSIIATTVEETEFLDAVNDLFLYQNVHTPTRDKNILDLIFTTEVDMMEELNVCAPISNSDHNVILFTMKGSDRKEDEQSITDVKFSYHKGNYKEMSRSFKEVNWIEELNNMGVQEISEVLKNEVSRLSKIFIPSTVRKSGKTSPWMKYKVKKSVKMRNRKWAEYSKSLEYGKWLAYKQARNKATEEIRKAKYDFELKLAEKIKTDCKSFYSYVKSKSKTKPGRDPLRDQVGNLVSDSKGMGILLNEYFSSVFTRRILVIYRLLAQGFRWQGLCT